jgi:hypothetical protein
MAKVRAYRNPIIYVVIAVALVAALLLLYLTPLGDSPAAGKRVVRNFDENVKLTANSGITISFKAKNGSCSPGPRCGKFDGSVTSPDSRCLAGRSVTITGPGGFTYTTTTDASGNYTTPNFNNLATGSYTAKVAGSTGYGFTCGAAQSSVTVS